MRAAFDLDSLNPEQREAVEWPGGPLLIFAGAGSGKTRVITCRIARLLGEGVPPYRIAALTFTNKAAREMRGRIEGMVSGVARDLWMGTFHAICARLLRRDARLIGLEPSFTIYDDADQIALVKEILKAKGIDERTLQPRSVLSEISSAKERLWGPERYAGAAAGYFQDRVAEIYPAYQKLLARAGAMDFDDIVLNAVRLMEESEEARQRIQDRFLHVLVDEYQDVNFAQYRLANLLSAKHRNITIVGDDDQSIYSWRGADVSLMLRFSSDHPDAKVVTLSQNYRSTQTILAAAHEVIRHNRGRADKRLWTQNPTGDKVVIATVGTEQEEAMAIADEVIADVRSGRRRYGDFAVLYRTNAQSRSIEEAFVTMRVPHVLIGGQRFYERKEIKDMLGYLRVVLNDRDTVSFRRIANVPARGIGPSAMNTIEQWAATVDVSLVEALRSQEVQSALPKKTAAAARQLAMLLDEARETAEAGPITPVLKRLIHGSGYWDALAAERTDEAIGRMENLQELMQVTAEYDGSNEGNGSLADFLENVSLVSDADQLVDDGDAVTLMTVHTAKGLEFPIVFLAGMEEGVFPHSRSIGEEREMDEERRLCYVGMTRAGERLVLLHAERRSLYGQANFNRRSRFLDDIPGELVELRGQASDRATFVRQARASDYAVADPSSRLRGPQWKPPFAVGQRVRHPKFGEGVVIACAPVKNDAEITVAFPGAVGVKKLVQSLAKLEVS
jgi:DNA helicase-2/ATP-dependent DNA helicase PcrA